MSNANQNKAKREKNDEFYTQLSDVEKEMMHYTSHFKDKVVYLNCNDHRKSAFWEYFANQFEILGLKKLVATQFSKTESSYKIEITGDTNGDGRIDIDDTVQTPLEGNGDFRNQECINILKEADIIVTNPPFSLFREYIAQLVEYDKKFLIIGNTNAITYKEIFPLIKEKKLWLGTVNPRTYEVPEIYEGKKKKIDGKWFSTHGNHCWFTNLDHKKRHALHMGYKTYKGNESDYPKYDNYDAIEVSKVKDIPTDFNGVMGVPITFLDKHDPDQFELLGCTYSYGKVKGLHVEGTTYNGLINGIEKYKRLFIKRK